MRDSCAQERLFAAAEQVFAQPAVMGALPILSTATAPDARRWRYSGPDGLALTRKYPKRSTAKRSAYDLEDAGRLWEVCEQLTGVSYASLTSTSASR